MVFIRFYLLDIYEIVIPDLIKQREGVLNFRPDFKSTDIN